MSVFSRRALARLLVAGLSAGAATGCFRDREARVIRERTETFDLLTRGQSLKAQGDYVLARDVFLKAAEQSPDRSVIFYEIANCYFQLGNREQAQAYYEKALRLSPDYTLAQAELDLVSHQIKMAEAAASPVAASSDAAPAVEIAQAVTPTPAPYATMFPEITPTPAATPTATPAASDSESKAAAPTPTPEVAVDKRRPVPRTPQPPPQAGKKAEASVPTPEPTKVLETATPAPEELSDKRRPVPRTPEATPNESKNSPAEASQTPNAKLSDILESPTATPPSTDKRRPVPRTPEATPAAKNSTSTKSTSPAPKKNVKVIEEDSSSPVSGPFGGIQQAFGGLAPEKRAATEVAATPIDPAEARKVIFPELAVGAMPTAEQNRAAAVRAEELGYYDEAVRAWSRYLASVPDDIPARLRLADTLQRSGRSLRSEKEYEMAEQLSPSNATVYFEKGNFYVRGKELLKAKDAFDKSLAIDPTNLKAKNNLAAVQQQMGNHSTAEVLSREVIAADPTFGSAWLNLALSQDDAGAPPSEVIDSLENYLRLSKVTDPKTEKWMATLKKKIALAPSAASNTRIP